MEYVIPVEWWGMGHMQWLVFKIRGLKCVGKKIHDILFNSVTPQEQARHVGSICR